MNGPEGSIPAEALDDVAYLSRSANRVAILDALARGPATRREVAEETGVSRTTLDRIVNELEDRGWAVRTTDGDYVTTPSGEHLMAQVRPFLDSVEAIRRLGEAVTWLPSAELTVGLQHFSDAVVRRPEQNDPMETVDYFTELVQQTTEFRVLAHLAPPGPLSGALRDCITAGRLDAEFALTDGLVSFLGEQAERRRRWREMLGSGADLYRTEGPIPCNLWIFDDLVLIKKSGPEPIDESYGVPIESEDETVRSWAHDLIDRHRADATRVDVDAFAEEATVHSAESGDE